MEKVKLLLQTKGLNQSLESEYEYLIIVNLDHKSFVTEHLGRAEKIFTRFFEAFDVGQKSEGLSLEDSYDWVKDAETIEAELKKRGMLTKSSYSVDRDQIFIKVGAKEEDLLAIAERRSFPLSLADHGGCMPYSAANQHIFQVYENGSRLLSSQKQQLTHLMMHEKKFGKRLHYLEELKVIDRIIPLHDVAAVDWFMTNWVKKVFRWQPLTEIRSYFGESIAMYFAFIEFYFVRLLWPAVVGIVASVFQFIYYQHQLTRAKNGEVDLDPRFNAYDSPLTPFYAIFITVWATGLVEAWKRRSNELAFEWNTLNYEEQEQAREDYRYQMRSFEQGSFRNRRFEWPIDVGFTLRTGKEKFYPRDRRRWTYVLSAPVILAVAGACIFCMVMARSFRDGVVKNGTTTTVTFLLGQLNTFILMGFNFIYSRVAIMLNNLENYRTKTQHDNALIFKTALFQFINSYGALLIICYWPNDDSDHEHLKMQLIFYQLLTIFITKLTVDNIQEVAVPWIKQYLQRKEELSRAEAGSVPSYLDTQSKKPAYESPFDDYAEIVVQFGYVTLFASGFPFGAVICFFGMLLEKRLDAYKLVCVHTRPDAKPAENIGTWQQVIEVLTLIAIINNSLFLIVTSSAVYLPPYNLSDGWTPKLIVFIAAEHALMAIVFLIKKLIPDMPGWIIKEQEYQNYKKAMLKAEKSKIAAILHRKSLLSSLA